MKMKFNWGTGIFIAIILFMAFILSFVYKSIMIDKYQHELVSEDYYKDELYYQQEIDKLNNANDLDQNISLNNSEKGITIQFPENLDYQQIKGHIFFQRRSKKDLDFKNDIILDSHKIIIPDSLLVSGKWIIKIDWEYKNTAYLFKEDWFY
ncbi:MAG: FixH family protein [Flavobacteriaceae bacterium]|nr:FixH family protein [Flavobacteriaceae bacterium]